MIRGMFRLIVGFAATVGMLAFWLAVCALVMLIALYLCRLIPQIGKRGRVGHK